MVRATEQQKQKQQYQNFIISTILIMQYAIKMLFIIQKQDSLSKEKKEREKNNIRGMKM